MTVTSIYPVLMSADARATAAFYQRVLGFEVVFEADWYVSMKLERWELAILDHNHDSIPEGSRRPVDGVLINLEVEDVDAAYARITEMDGIEIARDIRTEDWGQRHFIIKAPENVLLDIIQPIPVTGNYVTS